MSERDFPMNSATGAEKTGLVANLRRYAPLIVIAAAMVLFFAFDLHKLLSFETLKAHREYLTQLVADHAVLTAFGFVAVYALAVAVSAPVGAALSIAGGFLFGTLFGTLWIVIGATLGATAIFVAASTALGDSLRSKAGPWLRKMEDGFRENAFNYLLVLRLVPIFPFFVVNLVPAFLGVTLRTYVLATFIGIIPGAFVFASVGAGLGSVFESGDEFTPSSVLTTQVIVALVGLSVLSLVPVIYKKFRARGADKLPEA